MFKNPHIQREENRNHTMLNFYQLCSNSSVVCPFMLNFGCIFISAMTSFPVHVFWSHASQDGHQGAGEESQEPGTTRSRADVGVLVQRLLSQELTFCVCHLHAMSSICRENSNPEVK